jgi:pimeloyl-ACP methyl ester carboxylesterase
MVLALALAVAVDSATIRDITLAPGESLHVTIVGTGRPVVILPGLVASAYAFRKVIPHLAEAGLQAIVVEPLGVGASARPPKADYSLTAQSDRIAAVLDTLGVSKVLVVAHSVSVSMALRLAYRRPDLVGGVLADNGGPVESAATPGVRKAAKFAWIIKLFAGSGTVRKKIHEGLIETSGDTTWITQEVIDNYAAGRAGNLGAVLDVMKGMARSREPELLSSHLAEVGVPVRLLVGAAPNGSGINVEDQATLTRELRTLRVDSISGSGLHIHEEQPEVVVQAILEMARAGQ